MARETYKDCLARMREEGATIDAQDEKRIDELIDAGMETEDAIRLMFIERHANVVDFVAKRQEEGAEIKPYADTYDEVISRRSIMLARTMQNYMEEQQAIGDQIAELDREMDEIHQSFGLLETAGQAFGIVTRAPAFFRPTETRPTWNRFALATASDLLDRHGRGLPEPFRRNTDGFCKYLQGASPAASPDHGREARAQPQEGQERGASPRIH
jgi:hypothetical protein